ncbi:MAG TPA: MerR family transcriptional regulator [Bacillota bacterium]|nr:MerR family transcriptional regulator [Bacillota bacterium]HPE38258.1 MerR family transcriptional regulator [Bacillota bacterium]
MFKIGEFSKLSHLTVKALRFYEKEGLLVPKSVDEWTGYRFYDSSQLEDAMKIRAYRQLGLTIEEIKAISHGANKKVILAAKAESLCAQKLDIDVRLSIINHILEDGKMNYQVTVKELPEAIIYYSEVKVKDFSEMMSLIPELGKECIELNPGIKCVTPEYEFCEYLDGEYKETDISIRHNEAVDRMGNESERIKFKKIPAVKVLSIYHKGNYDQIGEAYAFITKYAEENGYKAAGLARESYIDGIWNKESVEDWLTEIQLPIE